MFKYAERPADKRFFDPQCSMTLTHDQLREVYNEQLLEWVETKKDDHKVNKPLTVSFDGVSLTIGHEAFEPKTFQIGDKQGPPVSLDLRPRDVVDLFKKLLELNVKHCAMHGDPDGLLAVSWEDEAGDYIVYTPDVDTSSMTRS